MSKEALFIPGHDTEAKKDYPKTYAALEGAGFRVEQITPPWEKRDFTAEVTQVSRELRQKIGQTTVVIAHSYGVMLALPELTRQPRPGIVLASPSLNCAEGLADTAVGEPLLKKDYPESYAAIQHYSLNELTKRIRTPQERAAVLVGEAETQKYPIIKHLATIAAANLGTEVTYAPKANHFIDYNPSYIETVVKAADRISDALHR
ncbi:MAG TPA: hypothetical protein VD907_02215 [Verrucomicrobiae bacterium]|nr:hypothetical protein [Verrucomicrobiae bacterium]